LGEIDSIHARAPTFNSVVQRFVQLIGDGYVNEPAGDALRDAHSVECVACRFGVGAHQTAFAEKRAAENAGNNARGVLQVSALDGV
jgi:hypothetical protein